MCESIKHINWKEQSESKFCMALTLYLKLKYNLEVAHGSVNISISLKAIIKNK